LCKDEIFIYYTKQSEKVKNQFLRVKNWKILRNLFLADEQYLFIFAEFIFADLGGICKSKFRIKSSAQISSTNNFSLKVYENILQT